MKRFFVALGWIAVGIGAGWLAPSTVSAVELDRTFLFLVDTSLSMSRIQGGTRQAVYDLVFSGIQGRMKAGDHYTIWTFNERVNTRAFIPMNWDPALNRALAMGASRFLGEQRLGKTTQLDKVIAELIPTAKTTDILTVFIISDGDDRMQGTAFDSEINVIYQSRGRELQRARKPFVTTLVFRGGNLASWYVTAGGENIPLPERNAAATSPTIISSMAPPLTPPATNAVAAWVTNKPPVKPQTNLVNAPPATALSPTLTNKPALPSAPPQPVPMATTAAPPAAVTVPVPSLAPASNKLAVLPPVMPSTAPTTNARSSVETSSVAKALSPSPPSTAETPASKPTSPPTPPPTPASKPQGLETNTTAATAPPAMSLVSTQSAVMKPLTIVEPSGVTTSVTQKTPLTASPATSPATTTSLVTTTASPLRVSVERSEGASVKVPKPTNDAATARQAAKLPEVRSMPEQPVTRLWPIMAVGCGFLGVAFCLGFFLLRRRRAPAPPSLISQSLDRDHK